MADPETETIVMIGEIGGQYEARRRNGSKNNTILNQWLVLSRVKRLPKEKNGACWLIIGGEDTAEAKMRIMKSAVFL